MGTQQDGTGTGMTMKRRGILAAAGAAVAGIVAKQASTPALGAGPVLTLNNNDSVTNPGTTTTTLAASSGFTATQVDLPGVAVLKVDATGAGGQDVSAVQAYGKRYGSGVVGVSDSGYGIYGQGDNYSGVVGGSASGYGVQGRGMVGVWGACTAPSGGIAVSAFIDSTVTGPATAVHAHNDASGPDSHGIIGFATHGHGLVGTCAAHPNGGNIYAGLVGLAAYTDTNAGNFYGNVAVTGNLYVGGSQTVAGAKAAALAHPDGSHRLVYCVEAPESWLEDFGKGTLTSGKVDVRLDPDFAAVADMTDYRVFITEEGDFHTHVTGKQAGGFTVQQTTGTGKSGASGAFSWRVVAKRKDVKAGRLAKYAIPQLTPPTIPPPHIPKLPTPPAPKKP